MGSSLGSLRILRCIGYESSWFRTSLSFPCDVPSLLSAGGQGRRIKGKRVGSEASRVEQESRVQSMRYRGQGREVLDRAEDTSWTDEEEDSQP